MKKIIFTISLAVSILLFTGCNQDLSLKAQKHCGGDNDVYICGENIKVVSMVPGAGSTFFKPDGTELNCPVVAPDSMSEECRQLIFDDNCSEICKGILPPQVDNHEASLLEKEINETDDWQTYKNEKYKYSFKYPTNCSYGPLPGYCKQSPPEERPQECRCYLNGEDENSVSLGTFTGTKSDLTGASFVVTSPSSDAYSPPADTDLITWLKEKFSYQEIPNEPNMKLDGITAVKVYTPFSGMAWSQEDIYFLKDNRLFGISILDVDNKDNRKLYDQIISTFKFLD